MNEPACEKFVLIRENFGFCQRHEHHMYLDPAVSPLLCDFCKVGADGKRYLQEGIQFRKNETVIVRAAKAEVIPESVPVAAAFETKNKGEGSGWVKTLFDF